MLRRQLLLPLLLLVHRYDLVLRRSERLPTQVAGEDALVRTRTLRLVAVDALLPVDAGLMLLLLLLLLLLVWRW